MFLGHVAAQLDRQIGNAARRVEHARRHERMGRTRLETQRAGAALIEGRRVKRERQAADDHAEKHPRPEIGVDHAGVLPDPADAGMLRVDALLDRPGVDVHPRLERHRRRVAHPREQRLESGADHLVVVVTPRVPRDVRASGVRALGRVGRRRVVDRGRDDDGLCGRQDAANIRPPVRGAMQVRHLTGIPAGQPFAEEAELRMVRRRRDAARVEPQAARLLLDRRRSERACHGFPTSWRNT